MSRVARSSTRADAAAVEAAQDKLLGYPSPGTHYGGGRHVAMPAAWQGRDNSPGWSSYEDSSEVDGAEFLTPIDRETRAALDNGRANRLTAQERTLLDAAERNAETRPEPDGGGAGTGSTRT